MEVRLNSTVTGVTRHGLSVGDEFIPVRNVFWVAGVKAKPAGPGNRAGRVMVGADRDRAGSPPTESTAAGPD